MVDGQNSCTAIRELIAWVPTGELSMDERRLVEEHVASCEACAESLRFAQEMKSALGSAITLHPEPDVLVQFVEDADGLTPDERRHVERHLEFCRECRREVAILRRLEREPSAIERLWQWASASVLQPLPAAGYLAAAVVAVLLLAVRPGGDGGHLPSMTPEVASPGARSFAGPVLLLQGAPRAQRGEVQPEVELPVWQGDREQLLLIEFVDLGAPPAPEDRFTVRIESAESGEPVWEQDVRAESFIDNYTLGLVLAPGSVPAGRQRVIVQGPKGAEVFRAELIVR